MKNGGANGGDKKQKSRCNKIREPKRREGESSGAKMERAMKKWRPSLQRKERVRKETEEPKM